MAAPKGLSKGFYFLIASHDPSFQKDNNQVSRAAVWVSDLALVVRTLGQQGTVEGFVLNAKSGGPIANATVTRWNYNYTRGGYQYQPADQTQSDSNGLFRFSGAGNQYVTFLIVAESGGDRLASGGSYVIFAPYSGPKPLPQTVFFTDRSLYRPGQTIQYKGICILVDPTADNYQTLAGQALTVVFRDVNGQEIARQQLVSNDYGSFSGSFTAPSDRLTGQMTLNVEGGPSGSTSINVEEYKRPTFRVQLDPPAAAPRSMPRSRCRARPSRTPALPSAAPRSNGASCGRCDSPSGTGGGAGLTRPPGPRPSPTAPRSRRPMARSRSSSRPSRT